MSRRTLLLADDSITIQKVVNLTFADEGIDVITVGDGNAALAELSSITPDILLADVIMPGPTGYEICEQLRANEATRNLPVILLVGSFEPFDEAEASRVGANAYLTKPFQSIKQLVAQVNELIDAAKPPVEEPAAEAAMAVPEELETPQPDASIFETQDETSLPEVASSETADATETAPRYFDDLGYETPAPPVEPVAVRPLSDDIDSLYSRSLSDGEEADLSDVGIDDEMIETSYTAAESANNDLAEFTSEAQASVGLREAGPQDIEEPLDLPPSETAEGAPTPYASGYEQRFPNDPSKFENTISYENWQPADMRNEEEVVEAETPESFETTRLDESFPQEVEQERPAVGDDTIRMQNRFDTTGSASFQFDDVNLLDLSNHSETPVEITSPANAAEQGSSKQVVTLSPELIEMIAQRVVEKLSEKY